MNHSFKSLAVSTIAALSITSLSSCDLDSLSSNGDTCSWGNTLTDIFEETGQFIVVKRHVEDLELCEVGEDRGS